MPISRDIDELVAGLESGDPAFRIRCAERLMQLGPEAAPAAAPLVAATANVDDEELLEFVVGALESIEEPGVSDARRLADLLRNDAGDVGYWAATLLGRMGDAASGVVPALIAALDEAAIVNTRQRAAWALGRIGPAAAAAGPSLERAARCDDPRLARLAAKALERIR